MINFEPKYVHCFWNNELKGKKGFIADTIQDLRMFVEDKAIPYIVSLKASDDKNYQFTTLDDDEDYQFCYYDSFYEMKVAYEEGKTIQIFSPLHEEWQDCKNRPLWTTDCQYRIKPNDEYEVVIMYGIGLCIVTTGVKDYRKVCFTGSEEECNEWLKRNKSLDVAIKDYFADKPIMYKEKGVKNDPWKETKELPYNWDIDHYEYRIATHKEFLKEVHSKKFVPFENTQEFIEAWEKKCPANKDRPNGTMPIIWVMIKNKNNSIHLITDFYNDGVGVGSTYFTFAKLFDECSFADGKPCGKETD